MEMVKVTCTVCGKERYWTDPDMVNDTCWECGGPTIKTEVEVY